MKLILFLLVTFSVLITNGTLAPPKRFYKILMMLPNSSKSHRNVFMPLANALADRGHKITMLSNHPLKTDKIEHYRHGLRHFNEDNVNMFEMGREPEKMFATMKQIFTNTSREIYDDSVVKMLYSKKDEFDLIVFDSVFNEAMYPFAHNKNFITVSTGGLDPRQSAVMGNILNPAYVSNLLFDFKHPYSFCEKLQNIFFTLMIPYNWGNSVTLPAQIEVAKRFPNLPPLLEIESKQSLSLLNTHFSFEKPVPLLPSQVEIGCIHCGPGKALPKDLEEFIKGDTPVVYMSLGSVAKSTTIPAELKAIIVNTFKGLPFKVLWKYEDASLGSLPSNIMIRDWMPQNDILAHKNVKVFISHCGLLGTHESMYHKTPVIGLPIGADQKKNAARLENSKLGLYLKWDYLTVESFDTAIKEVVTNPVYHENMAKVSVAFQDQMTSPVEKAVFWTEYVIRHDGAPHLRSPESDLSWIQLLHLDILAAIHLIVYLLYKFVKKIFSMLFKGSKKVNKEKKN